MAYQFNHLWTFRKCMPETWTSNNLKVQLLMLPDLLHNASKEHQLGIKKVTSITTLCQVFNSCNYGKTMLNEVHQLVRIYLTVPMTTATAERTFSTLRRLKNYLQSTMTQKRLNHIVLLRTHKHPTDELDLTEVASDFSGANSRRRAFFGSF